MSYCGGFSLHGYFLKFGQIEVKGHAGILLFYTWRIENVINKATDLRMENRILNATSTFNLSLLNYQENKQFFF